MEAILLNTSDSKKIKKALAYLKEIGISYSKMNKKEVEIFLNNSNEFSTEELNIISKNGEGLSFLAEEENIYSDKDLKVKY